MQKPTETLCCFSLKFIDILVDDDKVRIEKESFDLLINIINNIISSIVETIDRLEKEATDSAKVLGSAMLNTRNSLNSHTIDVKSVGVTKLEDKYDKAIVEVAKAMTLFNFCGLSEEIKIKDVNGNQIC
jgi:hypothetical protein